MNSSLTALDSCGGFEKISDAKESRPCLDRSHNPPTHIVLQAGSYVYTCPSCKKQTYINIPSITCNTQTSLSC